MFTTDPYVSKAKPLSILCLPLLNQGNLTGMLYLENDLVAGAFSAEQCEILRLLSTQFAISIENARLYTELEAYSHNLEDMVDEKTKELKATQAQLLQAEKMAALGDLVAGIAHEVNNPIGAINSATDVVMRCTEKIQLLARECESIEKLRDNPQFQKAMKLLAQNNKIATMASARVAKLVKNLKNFARLDEAEFKKADVHEGIDSTLILLQHKLKHKAEVIKDYGDIPEITCFPNQLNQVFLNMLVNAVQAIKERGTITIKTRADRQHVYVSFADTGAGIPKHNLEKIFNPGFTTKGVGVGTGLGLSISYNIIQKHKGEIKVESEVGKGTTFTLVLPSAR
jgi:signal transduction histidine kinase